MTAARAALLSLLLFSPCLPAVAQPARTSTLDLERPGPNKVRELDRTWIDSKRKRRVPVRIYAPAPKQGTKRALIVFSHGLGGSGRMYRYFGEHLASHGFVVIHPTHAGSDSVVARRGKLALVRAGADIKNHVARPKDISFVIDMVKNLRPTEALLRQVDMKKIGVAGHSFGAYTALAAVGQTIRHKGRTLSFTDRRIRASLAMSPQGPGTIGLTRRSWDGIRIPAFTMTGTLDTGLGTPNVADRRVAFDIMPPGNKHHLDIKDANHFAFSDNPVVAQPRDPRHHGWILAASTAFFRWTLEANRSAKAWLDRAQLQRDTLGEARQERR